MAKKTTKKVKLQPKHRQLTWGNQKIVPELRINGNWLSDHGFKAGGIVTITVEQNQLIIKPVS